MTRPSENAEHGQIWTEFVNMGVNLKVSESHQFKGLRKCWVLVTEFGLLQLTAHKHIETHFEFDIKTHVFNCGPEEHSKGRMPWSSLGQMSFMSCGPIWMTCFLMSNYSDNIKTEVK